MDDSYVDENRVSRIELARLIDELRPEDFARRSDNGWSISACLGHLAFWDRFVLARWDGAQAAGLVVPREIDDSLEGIINAAAVSDWNGLSSDALRRDVLEAAAAVDARIAEAEPEVVRAALERGRPALVDRSGHRREHIDQIRRTLAEGRARSAAFGLRRDGETSPYNP